MLQLILGGARSGKSRHAEKTAKSFACPVIYIATAEARDAEMQERIRHHQSQRPAEWNLVEAPLDLVDQLLAHDHDNQVILIDCLTLWLSNLLITEDVHFQSQQCDRLVQILPTLKSDVIMVSNETGLGVVPMGELSRRFVDESGRLHQRLGKVVDKVEFCVAGFAMCLKGEAS
ncbi:bifunctional adenosylcobinamide kinase/adenosylcobinamide-phosphate guanylyltransferase [Acinetobacter soli]|uniref:Bifunctional adenosylcobalamin biosynthesis protein n=1 Tax=Acinetobacter soli TaxID=487316 RepID=A0A1P8EGI9_9GAMM|nr:bifunctional adenosylcobinamide kinase/adenosylcobinamide-phosphate guanylyltransferase [Acinetobacter soli]APV35329.1 bifunctional adenosylcobinamide kinase/adenosylcobinamide-phosphate guanylyltransferase [Acinetobacter soli]